MECTPPRTISFCQFIQPTVFFVYDGSRLFSLHLGWRSLQKGLLDQALNVADEEVKVFVGPHIKVDSFEVGPEVVESFKSSLTEPQALWSQKINEQKNLISLEKIIKIKLSNKKTSYFSSDFDTCSSRAHHSYRRDDRTNLRNISFAFIKN